MAKDENLEGESMPVAGLVSIVFEFETKVYKMSGQNVQTELAPL